MSFLDDLKNTAESLGGAAWAVPGLMWDVASAPFDDDDDSILGHVADAGGKLLDPILNPATISGSVFGQVMEAANTALDYGINRPISTLALAGHHADSGKASGWEKALFGQDIGGLFDSNTWARAWKMSDEVNAGQAITGHALAGTLDRESFNAPTWDPFDYEDPYEERVHPEHGALASTMSWGINIAGAWYADPFAVGGKALGAARQASMKQGFGRGKLTQRQRDELGSLMTTGGAREASRVDRFADYVQGNNKLGRALTGPEIVAVSPEIRKWAAEPHVLGGLLADAAKIEDKRAGLTAIRNILAAGAGDATAIRKLQAQKEVLPYIADDLKNLRRGNVLDLKMAALNPTLTKNPLFIKHLEDQVKRLDSDDGITRVINEWATRIDQQIGTMGTLRNLPDAPIRAADHSKRTPKALREATSELALKRVNDGGVMRTARAKHRGVDDALTGTDSWARKRMERAWSGENQMGFIQKSANTVPLIVARAATFAGDVMVGQFTKAIPNVSDAMRQTHFTGSAHLHQWGDALTQLDSMLKIAHVDAFRRNEFLGKAALAGSEAEKQGLIARAESLAMHAMVERFSRDADIPVNRGYIEQLMMDHATRRGRQMERSFGRAYAATQATDDVTSTAVARYEATRGRSVENVEDQVTKEASKKSFSAKPAGGENWSLRVDQMIDEDGTPVAMPLFESQLANRVPLMDVGLAKKLVKQDLSHMSRLSRAWAREAGELDTLIAKRSTVKGKAAVGLEKTIDNKRKAMEGLVHAGQVGNRVWKMSVLFRLGYPVRVVLDDHWRIWTQMSAGMFYAQNGREALDNFKYNHNILDLPGTGGRKAEFRANRKVDADRAREVRDLLESEEVQNYPARLANFQSKARSASARRGQITKLRNQLDAEGADRKAIEEKIAKQEEMLTQAEAEAAYLQERLGDLNPDNLQKELAALHARLGDDANYKPGRRSLGQADVALGDGVSVPGAFAGGHGAALKVDAGSGDTFRYELKGVEDATFGRSLRAGQRTIDPGQPEHTAAWADALNNQIRNSRVAMHFVKGGTVDEFVDFIKSPEAADLRKRLPHFAHDPEDWGERVARMVEEYVPDDEIAERLTKSNRGVSQKDLSRYRQRAEATGGHLPLVHGYAVADTLGTSARTAFVGRTINKAFSWLAEVPTDRLSRHPFFNSMYKMHAEELFSSLKTTYPEGAKFSQADLDLITRQARKLALGDVKRTLFDMTAHSHAAHVMRFLSPFFAAHQEVLSRWWRILGENPGVAYRFGLVFDAPRHAGLVIDEEGNPVEAHRGLPGPNERLFIPVPKALQKYVGDSSWQVNLQQFNLVLQGGLANPGVGPMVTVPMEKIVADAADDERVTKVARLLNPFPPNSPYEAALPAWSKRMMAFAYGMDETKDLGPFEGMFAHELNPIGAREYADGVSRNLQDLMVDFHQANGREPNRKEWDRLYDEAHTQATVEAGLRFLNNAANPFPPRPGSKYAAIQEGWWKISARGRQKFPNDWEAANEWSIQTFKDKYGQAYMPLIYSDANNASGVDGSPAFVGAHKKYRKIVESVDPRLARAVMGSWAVDSGLSQERTSEAVNYFEDQPLFPGSPQNMFDTDDPRQAAIDAQARRGWDKVNTVTNALIAKAQQMGLNSYTESDVLVEVRRQAIAQVREENWAFDQDYGSFDGAKFNVYLEDLERLTRTPELANDPARTDIKVMAQYLEMRKKFVDAFEQLKAAGRGGPDAEANAPLRELYTQLVGRLVESNTDFASFAYDGLIEHDPLLAGE